MIDQPDRKMNVFVAVWFAGLLSLTGTVMTGFALGIWVYQTTGSATQFAAIVTVMYLPQVLVTVVSGTLADRYSRRRLMLLANAGAAVVAAGLALIVLSGMLSTIVVYVATLLFSVCSAIQYPAYAASVPLLVPARQLGRANGMVQTAAATSRVLGQAVAAALLPLVDILGIVVIDLATFGYMVLTLAIVRIPQPAAASAATAAGIRRMLRDIGAGWAFIADDPGLLRLLGFFALANVAGGFTLALFPPLVLDFAGTAELGLLQSIAGAGLLIGAVLMMVWGGPKRRVRGVLLTSVIFGFANVLLGVRAAVLLVAIGIFVYGVCVPVVNACNAVIWQTRVPHEIQGRTQGTLRMVAFASVPVTAIVAGILADQVFEPLMLPGGLLAGTVGSLIGTGPGRGTGLLLIIVGLLPVLAAVAAYRSRAVQEIENQRPPSVATRTAESAR